MKKSIIFIAAFVVLVSLWQAKHRHRVYPHIGSTTSASQPAIGTAPPLDTDSEELLEKLAASFDHKHT